MSLDEYLRQHNGFWENGAALVVDRGGYYVRLAVGDPASFTLTSDGKRLIGDKLANVSTDEIKSRKKREPKAVPKVVEPDELDLDDI